MHISGQLREADSLIWKGRTGIAHKVLYPDELELVMLIGEAAERLDDAHESWLEEQCNRLEAELICLTIEKF